MREREGGNERERGSCRGSRFIKEKIMQYASLTPISTIMTNSTIPKYKAITISPSNFIFMCINIASHQNK